MKQLLSGRKPFILRSQDGSPAGKPALRLFEKISGRAGRVIVEHDLIQDGDRILVGLSGGKDSMMLINVLLHRLTIAPVNFEIIPVHVDNGQPAANVERLSRYVQSLGLKLRVEKAELKLERPEDLNCFWCAWNRRKALFEISNKLGCRKIALAHHLDDIVESILMNQFFKGEISAMCPRQDFFDGAVTMIRPLAWENEETIRTLAVQIGLDTFETCRCPVSATSQRTRFKSIIRDMEKVNPFVKQNIYNSLTNIKPDYLPKAALGRDK